MALDIYDQCYLFLDGQLQAENISIETGLEADDQDAMTIPKGFAGITPSPTMRTVRASFLLPSTGFPYPFEDKFLKREKVKINVQSGATGKKFSSEGFLRSVNVSAGVGKAVEVSMEFRGTPSKFE